MNLNIWIFGFDFDNSISRTNFKQHDLTSEAKEGVAKEKLQELLNLHENMKFDAVVGNPPYQDETIGESTQKPPIYHFFVDISYNLAEKVCLITPARFLFNAGATPAVWNKKMLNDPHLKVTFFDQNSSNIFPGTSIKGGVAVTYWDSNKEFGKIGTFTVFEVINSILNKVEPINETLSGIIYSAFSYQFSDFLHNEHPEVEQILSSGHKNDISTNIFESLP